MTNPSIPISSKDNPKFKQVRALLAQAKQRKKTQQTVLEGTHLILSYLEKGFIPVQIWVSEPAFEHSEVQKTLSQLTLKTTLYTVDSSLYKQLRSIGEGIDILAVIDYEHKQLDPITDDVLILNDVQDTGNVGTLLRTASAVGIKNIVCTQGTASVWSPKCLRAGMGAQFSLVIFENVAITDISRYVTSQLLATSSHTDNTVYQHDLTQPTAWVMGNEGQGVCEQLMTAATAITLPQKGEESLNVAVAGALCMYEMLRQREYS